MAAREAPLTSGAQEGEDRRPELMDSHCCRTLLAYLPMVYALLCKMPHVFLRFVIFCRLLWWLAGCRVRVVARA